MIRCQQCQKPIISQEGQRRFAEVRRAIIQDRKCAGRSADDLLAVPEPIRWCACVVSQPAVIPGQQAMDEESAFINTRLMGK